MNTLDLNKSDIAREMRLGTRWCLALLTYYLVIAMFFIGIYQHEIDSDGTSYITLAQKYLAGDFGNAVTGHWAPMISWLMVPFLYFNLDPILAFRIVSLLIGIVTIVGIDRLLLTLQIRRPIRILYLFSLSPVIAWYAENDIGSDLICACMLVMYLLTVLRDDYQRNKYAGIISGSIGALAFLSKNYNFYFFFMHFTCINVAYWANAANKQLKKTVAVNFISAIVVFSLVGGTWIGLISHKYHRLTAGTAGGMTLLLLKVGPTGYPMLKDGFFPPPNETAMSAWEDPAKIAFRFWNPLDSPDDFAIYLKGVGKNISSFLGGMLLNYIFIMTVIFYVTALFWHKKRFGIKINVIMFSLLLYPVGYLILYYDGQRYIWFSILLLYVLSAYALNMLFSKYTESKAVRFCLPAILYVSLLALTIIRVNRDYQQDVFNLDALYTTSTEIARSFNMQNQNIASQDGSWNYALDLSYFLKARYFGMAMAHEPNARLRKELLDLNIHYYFVFGKLKNDLDILKPEKRFHSVSGELTIYKVVRPAV